MQFLCKMLGGSHAYGLNTPSSDLDYRGVFLNDELKHVLGLDKHEHQENISGGADDKYKELRRFFNLLRQGNTEALEVLFADKFELITPEFQELQKNRSQFVDTAKLFSCLRGYMQGERKLANGERTGKMGGKRKAALDRFGFSPRNFVQLFRLAWAGTVVFQEGFFPVNVRKHNSVFAEQLLAIKREPEKFTKDELNSMADRWESLLVAAYENRNFQYEFNQELANEWVFRLYMPMLNRYEMQLALIDISKYPSAEQISAGLIQKCDCEGFKKNNSITFDSQDLYEQGATQCRYCHKPFQKK